jgi:hypothetical protein
MAALHGSEFMVVGSTNLGGPDVGSELVYHGVILIEEFNGRSLLLTQD